MVHKHATELTQKHFGVVVPENDENWESQLNLVVSNRLSIYEQLQLSISSVSKLAELKTDDITDFKKELTYFEKHKIRSPVLEKLFDAILSIQPTSTQNEKNFSV